MDFSQARLLDRQWHRGLHLLVEGLQLKRQREFNSLRLHRQLAQLSIENIDPTSFQAVQASCTDIMIELDNAYHPWRYKSKEDRQKEMAAGWKSSWRRFFGDPNDPAVKAKMEQLAAALRQRSAQNRRTMTEGMTTHTGVFNKDTAEAMEMGKKANARSSVN